MHFKAMTLALLTWKGILAMLSLVGIILFTPYWGLFWEPSFGLHVVLCTVAGSSIYWWLLESEYKRCFKKLVNSQDNHEGSV
jgi:hypothetical protein